MQFARRSPRPSTRVVGAVVVVAAALAIAAFATRSHTTRTRVSPTTTTSAAPSTSTSNPPTSTRPRPTVTVPNVIGNERAAAVAALTKLGLAANVTTLANANLPGGFVLSQSPVTGTLVTPGTTVLLVVSAPS